MAQFAKLVSQYHPDGVYSFVVGSADIVANTLYVRDANGLLVQADASSVGPFFVPLTAEKAGYPVSAALVGTGTFVLLASGSIMKDAKLTNAAAGKVTTAGAGDEIVGTAWNAADDGELLTVVTAATVGGIYPTILEGAHGESVEEAWISEEITLATDSAATLSSANLLPANALILGAVIRVTEAINNRTAFIVGASAGDLDGLVATGTALTLNATAVGTGALIGTFNAAANTVTITTSGGTQNTTGKVRVSVLVRKLTAPTS
ncbi:MAG TPA: hypothetical protein PLL76_21365 [Thermoanaerobaculia bacterium]|nr:hypothetical protein [Thermoanaerobaculia bacterium]